MKLKEFIVDDEQIDEGPLGQAVAKGAGAAVRGLSAVAGGVRGAWDAAKQGFAAGRAAVAGQPAAKQKTTAAPAQTTTAVPGTSAAEPTGAAATAIDKTTQAVDQLSQAQANQTMFAQLQANIDKLDTRGKQSLLKLLQQSLKTPQQEPEQPAQTAAPAQTAEPAQTEPTPAQTEPAQTAAPAKTGPTPNQEVTMSGKTYRWLGAQWAEVNPATGKTGKVAEKGLVNGLNQLAAQAQTAPAQTAAPAQTEPAQTAAPAQNKQTPPGEVANTKKKPTQAEIDAERDRVMGNFTDSINRTNKNSLKESLSRKVKDERTKMFKQNLAQQQTSIYKK